MLENIKDLLAESSDLSAVFRRNLVKEYLQTLALAFIYSRKEYSGLIFYGGSALRHCHGLPRLSEDLDFVDADQAVDLAALARDMKEYFSARHGLKVETKTQKSRVVLKFPVLFELGLAVHPESDLLFLKLELYRDISFRQKCQTEVMPLFEHGESALVRTFDLPTLMATKIRAVLNRRWRKTGKKGETLAAVKGRDYFDLMWYLQKGVEPNIACIEAVADKGELYARLLSAVERIDAASIKYDLDALIADRGYVDNLAGNIKQILLSRLRSHGVS
ncbi:MAG: nucleotidyl transferase AbiEii/AbiGii toxin family protein [Elusimicrobia bacterium]|nr:nucleotidyl transferase AbiEii/AbiGii toxin family protein [Elusimicrobiota bacterium]